MVLSFLFIVYVSFSGGESNMHSLFENTKRYKNYLSALLDDTSFNIFGHSGCSLFLLL